MYLWYKVLSGSNSEVLSIDPLAKTVAKFDLRLLYRLDYIV